MVGLILVSPGKLGPIMVYGDGEGNGTMLYACLLYTSDAAYDLPLAHPAYSRIIT